jgi:hypothetical protein
MDPPPPPPPPPPLADIAALGPSPRQFSIARTSRTLIVSLGATVILILLSLSRRIFHIDSDLFGGGGGGGGGVDDCSTERAVGVGLEPGVDAGGVEGVAALGQPAEAFVLLELGEADGAIGAVDGTLAFSVLADGDGADDGLVQAFVYCDPPVVVELGGDMGDGGGLGTGAAAAAVATDPGEYEYDDDVDEDHEGSAKDGGEEDDDRVDVGAVGAVEAVGAVGVDTIEAIGAAPMVESAVTIVAVVGGLERRRGRPSIPAVRRIHVQRSPIARLLLSHLAGAVEEA